MRMIDILFLQIVGMSLTAAIVVGVVLFVRLLFKSLPKRFAYALWAVVAFRLIVPVSVDSDISIFNLFVRQSISSGISATDGSKAIGTKQDFDSFGAADSKLANDISGQAKQEEYAQNSILNVEDTTERTWNSKYVPEKDKGKSDSHINIMAIVWIAGMLMLTLYTIIVHIRIKRRVRYAIRLYDNVYECDMIRSPFVLGIMSPKIYLPFRLSETEQQCILAHERYHILRRDYLIKSFAYVMVIVYWFQPMVWVAYHLMCIDMEMSCDERIISELTIDMRKEYSRLLLAFATNKRQLCVSPLAFGEENTMKRVRNILNYKKTAKWKLAGGAVAIMITMAACATDANTRDAIVPEPDQDVETKSDSADMTGMSENNDVNNNVSNEAIVNTVQGTRVNVHHSEKHNVRSHQEEQVHHTIEHHQAQWAANTKFDLEFFSLDYADADKIIFHISSGLFQYSLQEQKIIRSIDLKALNCQAVQTGGECKVAVYQNSDGQLRAVITPYPYSDGNGYIYDFENDELFAYDTSLLDNFGLFDGFVSKYDSTVEEALGTWKAAENVLPLDDHSYGALCWGSGPDLTDMYYMAGEQKWQIFQKDQATLPDLQRQDDSFYQSFSLYSSKEIGQCLVDYSAFYNMHDYAGVCALSTGLEYSDELWQEFSKRTDTLSGGQEVSHSEDGNEYLFQFSYFDETGGNEQKVYVNFKYMEDEGWRAEGLPTE